MVFLIIRLAAIGLVMWAAFQFINYFLESSRKTKVCLKCDGKGYWYGVRERNDCKDCNGTGRLNKL